MADEGQLPVRWVDYPGEALFKSCTLSVGGVVYDWYGDCGRCGVKTGAPGPWPGGVPAAAKICQNCRTAATAPADAKSSGAAKKPRRFRRKLHTSVPTDHSVVGSVDAAEPSIE